MSGIVGVVSRDDRQDLQADLRDMLRCIAYRGPDGQGVWSDGRIGLGHCLLHASAESQQDLKPLQSKDGLICLVADARIDNREELKTALGIPTTPLGDLSDTELILLAYEHWGEECPTKLLGDFALAVWDSRQRRLFCARDPLGIKPFYYRIDANAFRFASMAGAFYADRSTTWEPHTALITLYLLRRFHNLEETLDKGVFRLPAGHALIFQDNKCRTTRYWDIDPRRQVRYSTEDEYAEHFLHLFQDAVRVRLRSNGPTGSTLSGGLDSSSIVCTAGRLVREGIANGSGLETFSLSYADMACDEQRFLDAVTGQEGFVHHAFSHEKLLPLLDFEQVNRFPDVCYFPTLYTQSALLQAARERGMRAILYGVGGDDLLTVWTEYLTDLWRQGRFLKLKRALGQASSRWGTSRSRLFVKYCLRQTVPRAVKTAWRKLRRHRRGDDLPDWIEAGAARAPEVQSELNREPMPQRFPTISQQILYEGLFFGWNQQNGIPMLESFAAHHGLELRCPFFDRRLVEFVFAVPTEMRGNAGGIKTVLRLAMRGILPETVRCRQDKAEFSCILEAELKMRQFAKLRELLRAPMLAALGLVQAQRLRNLFELDRNEKGAETLRAICQHVLWLELWCRTVAANPTREPRNV